MIDLRSRFGFHAMPFTREIQVQDRFPLPFLDDEVAALEHAVSARMSAALIAPAGTGKSTALRALVSRLPEARYRPYYVKTTDLSKRDMCREIAASVGAQSAGNYPMLVRRLQEHFESVVETDGLRPVLILDEAHDLRPDVLSMIRILTNFDMDSRLVISIVLAGQPLLGSMLKKSELEDVARRLAHCGSLRLLSRDELARYIEHRCVLSGAAKAPFDNGALDALYDIGKGNLRATDQLALKALEIAAQAQVGVVSAGHVVAARKTLP